MLPCVCLFVLLPLCVRGQADVLLSTPSKSLIFPTDQPVLEDTAAPSVPTTTESFANAVTTLEPHVPSSTTSQHALDRDSTRTIVQSTATTVTLNIPPAPLPTSATTAQPTPVPTNATTALPTPAPTNATTALPTPAPTNATTATTPGPTSPPQPTVGDYVVRAEWNSSACLMAKMGLQFSFKMGDHFQTVNLDPNPNVTKTSGICGNSGFATLVLKSDSITVQFIFANQTSKFFLSALNLTVTDGSGATFTDQTGNLSLWEASLGSSYMCKKEQSFNISDALILNTFELQVQPFEVMNDQFSTAHECSVDDSSLLIPIIVGAALAVLILIVVIAYVIGRRKTYVGYQTL
ncbi:lysosome-associated membrane glycoprotein 2 precursor [Silurus asotus]|uniref:Lysosome-associated membrane glycoprotein 2 n=1 Tax=Silurus asotus TaxID=30991 RepID=A0AAD5B7H2_SILAS|nr:lysosome-associated membrane glycoprotein 2 precursor [Silurus asotus]